MERSHILLSFFVIISLVFIVSANDGGYKMMSYDEGFPAYPWQRGKSREWFSRMQRTENRRIPPLENAPNPIIEMPKDKDGRYRNQKRTSTFEEAMAELRNFGRGCGVKVIYGSVPVPVILVPSYDRPQQ